MKTRISGLGARLAFSLIEIMVVVALMSVIVLGNGNTFEYNGGVMVWSFGPDKQADPVASPAGKGGKANEGVNKDNVLSWKE